MKKYSSPEVLFEGFKTEDVITASAIVYVNNDQLSTGLKSYDVEQMDLD